MTCDNSTIFVSKCKIKKYNQPDWKVVRDCTICSTSFLPYMKASIQCSAKCKKIYQLNLIKESRVNFTRIAKAHVRVSFCLVCNKMVESPYACALKKYCGERCRIKATGIKTIRCIMCKDIVNRKIQTRDAGKCCTRDCGFKWIAFIGGELRALRRIAANNKVKPNKVVNRLLVDEVAALKRIKTNNKKISKCKLCNDVVYGKHNRSHAKCKAELKSIARDRMKSLDSYKTTRNAQKAKRKAIQRGASHAYAINPYYILSRDKYKCYLCGIDTPKIKRGSYDDDAPEVDHVIPISKGGQHVESNLRCCCRKCNGLKSDKIY